MQRKADLVLRLLRAEPLDTVSRESQVPAHELETWKRVFLEQGIRGLRIRGEPDERELPLARAKIGELMMRLELAELCFELRKFLSARVATPVFGVLPPRGVAHPPASMNSRCFHDSTF